MQRFFSPAALVSCGSKCRGKGAVDTDDVASAAAAVMASQHHPEAKQRVLKIKDHRIDELALATIMERRMQSVQVRELEDKGVSG